LPLKLLARHAATSTQLEPLPLKLLVRHARRNGSGAQTRMVLSPRRVQLLIILSAACVR
jgi:hypothetical protein